ncbi:MAG: serine/threonine protein kinase, partial [Myxococcales bacterium]|nr:serine/threonine protein kinase [Myxococcales bacterium]
MPLYEQPQPFGRYTLLNRIAVGGMAEVYKAKISGVGGFEKILAIKRLHPNFTEDHQFIKMLLDEAKITAQLTHCNIAQIYDLGLVENQYYIVMEHIQGKDLFQILRKLYTTGIKIPIEAGVFIGMEICSGLHYAHNKRDANGRPLGIIHRDISPQNILLSFDGEVKIIDFGIAKAAERFTATETGVIKGKFYYMSPEQAKGLKLDHRSDIFSAGLILYEILTSSLVYTDEDDVTLLHRVQEANIRPPLVVRPELSPMLDKIIMKSLSADPDQRYQNALEMHRSLANYLLTLPSNFGRHDLGEWVRNMFSDDYKKEVKVPPKPADPVKNEIAAFFQKRRDISDGHMIPLAQEGAKPPVAMAASGNGNASPASSELAAPALSSPPPAPESEGVRAEAPRRKGKDFASPGAEIDPMAATRIEQIDMKRSEAATVLRYANREPQQLEPAKPDPKALVTSGDLVGVGAPQRKRKHQQLLMWTLVGLSWIIIAFGVLIVVSVRQRPHENKSPNGKPTVEAPAKLLVLDTEPPGAMVILNDKPLTKLTPVYLPDLPAK